MNDDELLEAIAYLKRTMTSVSTGGARIETVDDEYQQVWHDLNDELRRRSIANPNPHRDLWDWHGRWSDGTLPNYASRRTHIREMYVPVDDLLRRGPERRHGDEVAPTGWMLVDRQVARMRDRLATAETAEDFQAVGLLGREVIISLAQAVYDHEQHAPEAARPSNTDAKRMLDAYISKEMPGAGNDEWRRAVKSALQAAVALQHKRDADRRTAALCYELTVTTVNCVSKLEETAGVVADL